MKIYYYPPHFDDLNYKINTHRIRPLPPACKEELPPMDKDILRSLDGVKKELRKEDRSLRNRIQSILFDNNFLETQVIPTFPKFPIIPNERCGIWYCDPKSYKQTSYFKSTDGHINQWDFSTRRLNFHLFPTLATNGGIIIVDSTRRGKKIPDSLSKTVPIWCAVLNGLMLRAMHEKFDYEDLLYVPPDTISQSERSIMVERLADLIRKVNDLQIFDGKTVYESFNHKLLRPFWVHPGSSILESARDIFTGEITTQEWTVPEDSNIIPIILCTVSYQAQDGIDKRNGFTYHQGAADDHELWSNGLEPDIFWKHIDSFKQINATDVEVEQLVDKIVSQEEETKRNMKCVSSLDQAFENIETITNEVSLSVVMDGLIITKDLILKLEENFSRVIILSDSVQMSTDDTINPEGQGSIKNNIVRIYPLQSGSKKSSKELRTTLIEIDQDIKTLLGKDVKPTLICCNSGKDLSIGVILMILSKYYTPKWQLLPKGSDPSISKATIRKNLISIIAHLYGRNVNPSRATLNSINSFLM